MVLYSGSIPTEYCYKHHLNVDAQNTQEPLIQLFLNLFDKKRTVNIITVRLSDQQGYEIAEITKTIGMLRFGYGLAKQNPIFQ